MSQGTEGSGNRFKIERNSGPQKVRNAALKSRVLASIHSFTHPFYKYFINTHYL
jgi:hypothetical protein